MHPLAISVDDADINGPIKSRARRNVKAGILVVILVVATAIMVVSWYPAWANDNRHIEKDASEIVLKLEQTPQGFEKYRALNEDGYLGDNVTDAAGTIFSYSSKISGNAQLTSLVMIYNSVENANKIFDDFKNGRLGPDAEMNGSMGVGYQSILKYDPSGGSTARPIQKTLIFTYGNVLGSVSVEYSSLFSISDDELAKLGKKMVNNMK
jgi:hypothetical protein